MSARWMLKSWSVRYPHQKLQFGFIRNLYTWNSSHLNDTQKYEDVKGNIWKDSVFAKKKTIWHLLNGRVDLKGLGELLIRTKQKYLWIQFDQNKFAKFFGSINNCNNNRCKGEAKNIANYFTPIVFTFPLQWQPGEPDIWLKNLFQSWKDHHN